MKSKFIEINYSIPLELELLFFNYYINTSLYLDNCLNKNDKKNIEGLLEFTSK